MSNDDGSISEAATEKRILWKGQLWGSSNADGIRLLRTYRDNARFGAGLLRLRRIYELFVWSRTPLHVNTSRSYISHRNTCSRPKTVKRKSNDAVRILPGEGTLAIHVRDRGSIAKNMARVNLGCSSKSPHRTRVSSKMYYWESGIDPLWNPYSI